MRSRPPGFAIRSFREGDEEAIAQIFNDYMRGFFGPIRVTPETWREQFRHQSWTGPSLAADADCVRVAERAGQMIGYSVTDYEPESMPHAALVQELCVTDADESVEVAEALLADAETRALQRRKSSVETALSGDDGTAAAALVARGYETRSETGDVFMARVLDLGACLTEILSELRRRLEESAFRRWSGTIRIAAQGQSCLLRLSHGGIETHEGEAGDEADISATSDGETLSLLLLGRASLGELYTQDALAVTAADRDEALRLLAVLFPPLPAYLPRAQWW
jgi:hypothetical protein